MRSPFLLALLVVCACSSGGGSGSGGAGGGSAVMLPVENCLGENMLTALDKTALMVGMATSHDEVAAQAPWDVRYLYLSAGIADGPGPCQSCASSCTSANSSCANSAGCAWWGCYQYDQDPPGDYVRSFVKDAKKAHEVPMITYYEELNASLASEGKPQIDKMNDAGFMGRYFADWRFVLQQVGMDKALLHLEPDLWGYAMQANADPRLTMVAVAQANATDCSGQPNTFAGFGACMIAMARKYAPNAKVGFHASSWATNMDVYDNTRASFDVTGEANKAADFLKACGADQADFVVVEISDRDAGYYAKQGESHAFWDITNATLPNFHQAFAWATAVSERIGRPLLWWQLPVGDMALNDTPNHYRGNVVDYFFAHTDEVAATHAVLMAFGAGADDQTDPGTDNGYLVAKVNALATAGGQPMPCH